MPKHNVLPLCTVLFLVAPLLFFTYGWLKFPLSIVLLIFLIILILFVLRDLYICLRAAPETSPSFKDVPGNQSSIPWIVGFIIILLWVLLSGAGGFGLQNDDYRASNALLKDLIEQPWPLTVHWHGMNVPIVYYVGWYLPAAFVGKLLGWSAANIASFGWTFIGTFLSFLWFLRITSIRNLTVSRMVIAAAIFCLADGLDFLLLNTGWNFIQYSSQTILLYWVPQHAIPAWLLMGLVADYIRGHLSTVQYMGISLAASVICSPFGMIGVLPFLLVLLLMGMTKERRHILFSPKSLAFNLGALPYALIGLLYLSSNEFNFPQGFLWEFTDSPLIYVAWLVFCLIEYGVIAVVVFLGMWLDSSTYRQANRSSKQTFHDYLKDVHGIDKTSYLLFVVAVLFLTVLPSYRMGYNDDLVMRGSIPALFVFWAFISRLLADSGFNRNARIRLLYLTVACLTIIGFHMAVGQIWNSVTHYRFAPPDPDSVLTTATVNSVSTVGQRVGSADTFFFKYLGK